VLDELELPGNVGAEADEVKPQFLVLVVSPVESRLAAERGTVGSSPAQDPVALVHLDRAL